MERAVLDVEFSRDGRHVATGGVDGLAKTWDATRGKLRDTLTLRGHTRPVGSVSFDRAETQLATSRPARRGAGLGRLPRGPRGGSHAARA